MTRSAELGRLAEQLWEAAETREPIRRFSDAQPWLAVGDAYRIQTLNVERSRERGARVVGHKIGLTSPAMQRMMGVDTPDFGALLDTMWFSAAEPVPLDRFIQPRVEPELAFCLRDPLPLESCDVRDVLAATAAIAPCIELIDSRIADWDIGLIDTISDNASSGGFVLGEWQPAAYADQEVILSINGRGVAVGATSDVLGNPAAAVAWLANELGSFGTPLAAGHIVLSGSCTRAHDVVPGDRVRATFGAHGRLDVDFAEAAGG